MPQLPYRRRVIGGVLINVRIGIERALGDKAARIFCGEFRAEIVSIAGHYRVFEELPKEYADKAVQIRLEQDKLQITRL